MADDARAKSGRSREIEQVRAELEGTRNLDRYANLPMAPTKDDVDRQIAYGLEAATSVDDRTISTFVRGIRPSFAGINTFLKTPYIEDVHDVGTHDVAIVGVPFDSATAYRSGARFGPQAVRKISAIYDGVSLDFGCDLREQLDIVDVGDVFVIPSNVEKTFDQIDRAVSFLHQSEVFPVIIGGDHSIGYPNVRGLAPQIDGRIGIVHLDRHIDMAEKDMDERMHSTPWFHATMLPNVRAANLVQCGIGGWWGNGPGLRVAKDRDTTVITMGDIDRLGVEKAVEVALELAWQDCETVYLSLDIDCVDVGSAPGVGCPEPGGFLPREMLQFVRGVAKEGLCGMELVEVCPPYDVNDNTAQLGVVAVMDVLATLLGEGKLGQPRKAAARERITVARVDAPKS
ncbi:agmatinase family protein [Pseudonocardia sp. H11422]|uniref:agmatinase family protein n=1 Tax=Pseudonocardia sp. H11422 TaxID=2835866 RepID=UPI001BDD94F5|nr:agmatinase family protein [Pseudonocardia sp. H11422]